MSCRRKSLWYITELYKKKKYRNRVVGTSDSVRESRGNQWDFFIEGSVRFMLQDGR